MSATRIRSATPELLDGVLDALPQAAVLIDADRRIVAANAAFAAKLARSKSQIVGHACHEVFHGRPRACAPNGRRCPLEACRLGEAGCRVVHVHRHDRGRHHVEVRLRPIPAPPGSPEHFLGILAPIEFASVEPHHERLVGRSEAFNRVLEQIRLAAGGDAPVLIGGEPGTGKETIARTIHEIGPRAAGPFVCYEGGGASESSFERELLGGGDRTGLIAAAAGGTLCVADVDELPVPLQARLLHTLEQPNLGTRFRTIATTTRDLESLVQRGRFRSSLRLRLATLSIVVPPLRDRRDDIPLLAESLLRRIEGPRGPRASLHPATVRRLQGLDLPGNVRELFGILERAYVLADGREILPSHLPEAPGPVSASGVAFQGEIVPLAEAERGYIAWALARFDDRHSELARRLGISPRTLYRKLEASRRRGDD